MGNRPFVNVLLFLMVLFMGVALATPFFLAIKCPAPVWATLGANTNVAPLLAGGDMATVTADHPQASELSMSIKSRSKAAPRGVIDFAKINEAALARLPDVLVRLLPDGHVEARREYVALNPRRNDTRRGSFKINLSTGVWADFATGDRGRDVISLVAYLAGTSQGDAARQLADFLGVRP